MWYGLENSSEMEEINMEKMPTSIRILIVAIIVFLLGLIEPIQYEVMKDRGYTVDARVVKVVTWEETDSQDLTHVNHMVYVDYEFEGKKYEKVKLGKFRNQGDYQEGNIVQVVINPNKPGVPLKRGGIFSIFAAMVIVGVIIHGITELVVKAKKKKREGS